VPEERTRIFSVRLHMITVRLPQNTHTTSSGKWTSPLHRTAVVNLSRCTATMTKARHRTHSASCAGRTDENVFCTSTYDHSASPTEHPHRIIWKVDVAVTSYGSRERQLLYRQDDESTTSYTFSKLCQKNGRECFLYVYK